MRRPKPSLLILLALHLLASTHCLAQADQPGFVSSVVREAFALRLFASIDLPQASVRAVQVGSRGYLWVGTREGLVRYKAGQQRVWQQSLDGRDGLPSGVINALHEDRRGVLWVGTARGVARLDPEAEEFRSVIESTEAQPLLLDVLNFVETSDALYGISASGEILRFVGDSVEIMLNLKRVANANPTSAAALGDSLYVGSVSGKIFRLRDGDAGVTAEAVHHSRHPVVAVNNDRGQLQWLDREDGLIWTEDPQFLQLGGINPMPRDSQGYYRAMTTDAAGTVWFAAGPNVIRYKDGRADVVRLPGRGNEVRSITVGSAGNIWIGTYYGLYTALDTDFTVLETAAAYDAGVILSLAATDEKLYLGGQNLWVGDLGADSFTEYRLQLDDSARESLRLDPLSVGQNPITALAATERYLLAGYLVSGMDIIDFIDGSVTNVTASPEGDSFEGVGVSSFAPVRENVWLTSFYLYGLVELRISNADDDGAKISLKKISNHPALIGVYRIDSDSFLAIDEKRVLLVERNPDESYTVTDFDGMPPGIVFAVEPDGEGGAYLGIENTGIRHIPASALGSARYEPEVLPFIEAHLARSTIWHLLIDDDNTLWATTNQGIYTFDLSAQQLLSHLTQSEGLPADEFDYGPHAHLLTPDGRRMFVSAQVPVVFSEVPSDSGRSIELFWTEVSAGQRRIRPELSADDEAHARLDVSFAEVSEGALDINYAYNNHVRASELNYGLRFSDQSDWVLQREPRVTITRQQRWGPLSFEIAMLDARGNVVSEPLRMTVDVEPPGYFLWIVDLRYAVPAVAALALALLLVQQRGRRRQRELLAEAGRRREIFEAEMRGRLSEKEILLRELHHRVGNVLTNFSASIAALQRSTQSRDARDALASLHARLKVQSAVHRLLQRSDRTDIDVASMLRQVVHGTRDLFEGLDTREVALDLDEVYMIYSKAQYLGLIVNELTTNAYKHARSSRTEYIATLTMTLEGQETLRLHYRDYGPGLTEDQREEALAKRRYSELKGLGQVVGLARELHAEPRLYNENGLHFQLSIDLTRGSR